MIIQIYKNFQNKVEEIYQKIEPKKKSRKWQRKITTKKAQYELKKNKQ